MIQCPGEYGWWNTCNIPVSTGLSPDEIKIVVIIGLIILIGLGLSIALFIYFLYRSFS